MMWWGCRYWIQFELFFPDVPVRGRYSRLSLTARYTRHSMISRVDLCLCFVQGWNNSKALHYYSIQRNKLALHCALLNTFTATLSLKNSSLLWGHGIFIRTLILLEMWIFFMWISIILNLSFALLLYFHVCIMLGCNKEVRLYNKITFVFSFTTLISETASIIIHFIFFH